MAADASPPSQRNRKKRPNLRREGREAALQFLFSHDLNEALDPDAPEAADFWNLRIAKPKVRDFATELLRGLMPHLSEIDEKISDTLENYDFHRLAAVDRNLLRLGVFELLFRDDIPAPVSINEAIEISKDFGNPDSPKFVNGILDRIRKEHESGR